MSELPIFEYFLSVGESQAQTQVVFQAETQAKNCSIELPTAPPGGGGYGGAVGAGGGGGTSALPSLKSFATPPKYLTPGTDGSIQC